MKQPWSWPPEDPSLRKQLVDAVRGRIESYRSTPRDIEEHVSMEMRSREGGYRGRAIYELAQNALDAMVEAGDERGRVVVLLEPHRLVVANTGAPLDAEGIDALLYANIGRKRGQQIGRFGLGFKSVLQITRRPMILSRCISLAFDEERVRDLFERAELPPHRGRVPVLRFGFPIDAPALFERDSTLAELGAWATTLVVLPFDEADQARVRRTLHQQLANEFRAEFLLFAGANAVVEFIATGHAEGDGVRRRMGAERIGANWVRLSDGDGERVWWVFERSEALPDGEIARDAGELYRRDEIPIAWAVPSDDAQRPPDEGRLWEFFPLSEQSRIPGILNAPWKVSDDRRSLLEGLYNEWLSERFGRLIAESLPALRADDDPGVIADYLPRRDGGNEFAEHIARATYKWAARLAVVPDASGALRAVHELRLPPLQGNHAGKLAACLESWAQMAPAASLRRVVHASLVDHGRHRERLGRLRRLAAAIEGDANACPGVLSPMTVEEWLEAVAEPMPQRCVEVLRLARALHALAPKRVDALKCARVVLGSDGELHRVADAQTPLFFLELPSDAPKEAIAVHPDVVADPEAQKFLGNVLGLPRGSGGDWLGAVIGVARQRIERWRILAHASHSPAVSSGLAEQSWEAADADAESLWQWLDSLDDTTACEVLRTLASRGVFAPVRTLGGTWRQARDVVLAGGTVRVDEVDEDGAQCVVDPGALDERRVRFYEAAGVREEPHFELVTWEPWYDTDHPLTQLDADSWHTVRTYLDDVRPQAQERLSRLSTPRITHIFPTEPLALLRPLWLLAEAPPAVRARVTRWLYARDDVQWHVGFSHDTRPQEYGSVPMPSPTAWMLRRYGIALVEGVEVSIGALLWARAKYGPRAWLEALEAAAGVSTAPLRADARWPSEHANAPELWDAATALALSRPQQDWSELYVDAIRAGRAPLFFAVGGQRVTRSDVRFVFRTKLSWLPDGVLSGLPLLFLRDDEDDVAEQLEAWGAREVEPTLRIDGRTMAVRGEGTRSGASDTWDRHSIEPFEGYFDDLPLEPSELEGKRLPPVCEVESIELELCGRVVQRTCFVHDDVLFVSRRGQVLADSDLLVEALGALVDVQRVDGRWVQQVVDKLRVRRERMRRVNGRQTLEEKLLGLVGDDAAVLRDRLSPGVAALLPAGASGRQAAEMYLASHGVDALRVLHEVFVDVGLEPPARTRWTGSDEALEFVEDVGFPRAYAGVRNARVAAWGEVSARGPVPPLHPYQRKVAAQLREVLRAEGPSRAMVSLPTGSGKTRVVVDVVVEEVLAKNPGALVLWVAQQEELCEQALQTFIHVWSQRRGDGQRLVYSRLWGGRAHLVRPHPGRPHLVVATIQTLKRRFDERGWEWLSRADVVVVDEAHRATAPSYTRLRDWLRRDDAPWRLIGLTATPFRSDDAETRLLVGRFGKLIPPNPGRGLYEQLVADGYLAHVDPALLEIEGQFDFDEQEVAEIERFHYGALPESALKRLAANRRRNERIVGRVTQLPEGSKVLLFACNVEHAQVLAAMLRLQGRKAAAITGQTRRGLRRQWVDEFLRKDLNVLVNVGVLTTGFDAPKVDAIVIARPTFSPVLYMQMVGRGLRGPRNGGKECCLLVDVVDNFVRFGDRLSTYDRLIRPWMREAWPTGPIGSGEQFRS